MNNKQEQEKQKAFRPASARRRTGVHLCASTPRHATPRARHARRSPRPRTHHGGRRSGGDGGDAPAEPFRALPPALGLLRIDLLRRRRRALRSAHACAPARRTSSSGRGRCGPIGGGCGGDAEALCAGLELVGVLSASSVARQGDKHRWGGDGGARTSGKAAVVGCALRERVEAATAVGGGAGWTSGMLKRAARALRLASSASSSAAGSDTGADAGTASDGAAAALGCAGSGGVSAVYAAREGGAGA